MCKLPIYVMAKRRKKVFLSDLLPEFAVENVRETHQELVVEGEERQEEPAREEPAREEPAREEPERKPERKPEREDPEREDPERKAQKVSESGHPAGSLAARRRIKAEEKWNARLEVFKQWRRTKGRFPKGNKEDKEEHGLYKWLHNCKPGGLMWTKERWEKVVEVFKEGPGKSCPPCPDVPPRSHQIRNSEDEAHWDATLEVVKEFKWTRDRFPRSVAEDAGERRLYKWLYDNMDDTSDTYTDARARKLVAAFDEDWEVECFTRSSD